MRQFVYLLLLIQALAIPVPAQTPAGAFDTHLRAAQTAVRAGLPLLAAREYRAALALHPQDAAACYALAGLLEQAGRTDEAIAWYRETLRLRPDNAPAHNALAGLLEAKGETSAALAQRRQALVLEPDNPLLHFNLGAALEDAGQQASARAEYQAALRLKPNFTEAQQALAEPRKVMPAASGPPGLPPISPPRSAPGDLLHQAIALEAAGRLTDAIAAFHEALTFTPYDPSARLHLGIALYADGQTTLARREWERVLALGNATASRQAQRLLTKYP